MVSFRMYSYAFLVATLDSCMLRICDVRRGVNVKNTNRSWRVLEENTDILKYSVPVRVRMIWYDIFVRIWH